MYIDYTKKIINQINSGFLSLCFSFKLNFCFIIILNHSGLIGRSWAMLFAAANYKVVMYDLEESQLTGALTYIRFVLFFK